MADDKNVELQIRAKNLTAEAFAKVSEALKALEDQSESTSKKGSKSWGSWFATIAGGVAVGNLISSAFKSVGGMLAEIPGQLLELAKRGNDVAAARGAFTSFAGGVAQARDMLAEMKAGMGHTIPEFELMTAANDLLRRGVGMTGAEFKTIGQASRILADQVGGNAKEAFESMLSAVGRGNERELKQLGVNMANVERVVKQHADALGKEVSALSEAQKQQALKNAVLAEANRLLQENGAPQTSFNDNLAAGASLIQDWKDRLGEAIATSPELNVALSQITGAMMSAFGADRQTQVQTLARLIGHVAIASANTAQWVVSGAQTMASAYYKARAAVDSMFKVLNDARIRKVQDEIELVRGLAEAGFDGQKARLAQLESELTYLKGFSNGLVADAKEAAETNAKLSRMAADAQQFLSKLSTDMAAAGARAAEAAAGVDQLTRGNDRLSASTGEVSKQVEEFTKKTRDLSTQLAQAAAAGELEAWARKNREELLKLAEAGSFVGRELPTDLRNALIGVMDVDISGIVGKQLDEYFATVQQAFNEGLKVQNDAFTTNLEAQAVALREVSEANAKRTLSDFEFQKWVIVQEGEARKRGLDEHASNYDQAMTAIEASTRAKLAEVVRTNDDAMREMARSTLTWENAFVGVVSRLPGLLKSALTGGGGLKGFVGALFSDIGAEAGTKLLSGPLNKGLQGLWNKGVLSTGLTSALSAAVPGIGAAIGAMAGPLLGKLGGFVKGLFGDSKEEKEQKEATKRIRELGAELVTTYGSMANLRLLGQMTGTDIASAFGQKGKKGLEQFQKDIEGFKKSVGEFAAKFNSDLSGVLAQTEGVGFRLPATVQPYLDKMKELGLITEDNQRLLSTFGEESVISTKKMEEAASVLGVKFESLGTGFRSAKINETAALYLESLDLLRRGGADMGAVTADAAEKISKLVQDAQASGTPLAENWRPYVEELIKSGKLLDANGEKIEDINTLSFGDPIKVGLERIGDLLERLLKGLGIDLPAAFSNIPRSIDIDVNVHENRTRSGPYEGEDPRGEREYSVPGAAAGGLFARPTFRVVGEREPEIVGTPHVIVDALTQALQSVGGGMAFAGGEIPPIQLQLNVDGRVFAEAMVPRIPGVIKRHGLHLRKR